MAEIILVVAAWGVFGGYVVGASKLFSWFRAPRKRSAEILWHAVQGDIVKLAGMEPQYGMLESDLALMPDPLAGSDPKVLRQWKRKWRFNYVVTCNVCIGIWFCGVALAVWAAAAGVNAWLWGGAPLLSWVDAVPVLGAACAVHVIVTEAGNRLRVW